MDELVGACRWFVFYGTRKKEERPTKKRIDGRLFSNMNGFEWQYPTTTALRGAAPFKGAFNVTKIPTKLGKGMLKVIKDRYVAKRKEQQLQHFFWIMHHIGYSLIDIIVLVSNMHVLILIGYVVKEK